MLFFLFLLSSYVLFILSYQCASMTTQEIATKLVEYISTGKLDEAHDTLYSHDVISNESFEWFSCVGLQKKKERWVRYEKMYDMTWFGVKILHVGEHHICLDLTFKVLDTWEGDEVPFEEICMYTVGDAWVIIKEDFFYTPLKHLDHHFE